VRVFYAMKKYLILIILLLIACSQQPTEKEGRHFRNHVKWKADDVVGYKLTIISSNVCESLHFHESGEVSALIGTVNRELAAPIYKWEIDKDGFLIIRKSDNNMIVKVAKIAENKDIIIAECERDRMWSECKYKKEKN
jgi:hypothetical protein